MMYHSSLICFHLKDWPHLRVVSMHSSVRLMGNLRHSDALRAMGLGRVVDHRGKSYCVEEGSKMKGFTKSYAPKV